MKKYLIIDKDDYIIKGRFNSKEEAESILNQLKDKENYKLKPYSDTPTRLTKAQEFMLNIHMFYFSTQYEDCRLNGGKGFELTYWDDEGCIWKIEHFNTVKQMIEYCRKEFREFCNVNISEADTMVVAYKGGGK